MSTLIFFFFYYFTFIIIIIIILAGNASIHSKYQKHHRPSPFRTAVKRKINKMKMAIIP